MWFRDESVGTGPECTYDFAWLEPDAASRKWLELGLIDDDF